MICKRSWLELASEWIGLRVKVNRMSDAIEALKASVSAAESRLDGAASALTGLRATVAALQARLDAQPNNDSELTALSVDLNSHVAAFDTALTPPAPVDPPATEVDTNDGADN